MDWDLHQIYWKESYSHISLMTDIQFYIWILILDIILPPWIRKIFNYNPDNTPQYSFDNLYS
jgi:hypothetical protein